MNRFFVALLLTLSIFAASSDSAAQSPADPSMSATCATFTANPDDVALQAYLAGYLDAASYDPHYVLAPEAKQAQVRSVADWCAAHPRDAFPSALRAVIQLPGGPSGPVLLPVSEPTSCRVGPTQACSGCSISCRSDTQATCKQGGDFAGGRDCAWQAQCTCK